MTGEEPTTMDLAIALVSARLQPDVDPLDIVDDVLNLPPARALEVATGLADVLARELERRAGAEGRDAAEVWAEVAAEVRRQG